MFLSPFYRIFLLPEYHPLVHHEVEDAGEDEGDEIAEDQVEACEMAD